MNTWVWYSVTAQGQPGQGGKSHDSPGDAAPRAATSRSGAQERVAHDGAELIGESPGAAPLAGRRRARSCRVVGYVDGLVDVLVHEQVVTPCVPHARSWHRPAHERGASPAEGSSTRRASARSRAPWRGTASWPRRGQRPSAPAAALVSQGGGRPCTRCPSCPLLVPCFCLITQAPSCRFSSTVSGEKMLAPCGT